LQQIPDKQIVNLGVTMYQDVTEINEFAMVRNPTGDNRFMFSQFADSLPNNLKLALNRRPQQWVSKVILLSLAGSETLQVVCRTLYIEQVYSGMQGYPQNGVGFRNILSRHFGICEYDDSGTIRL